VTLSVHPVIGIGEVRPGEDVGEVLAVALESLHPKGGDVLVVTHKIVSKAEGRVVAIAGDEEEFKRALVQAESARIVRRRGNLLIAETKHGFICANAGVDRSNALPGTMILLPEDPDRSAHRIRIRIERRVGVDLPVIISDTFGRPWRRGLTDIAIGVSGLEAVIDLRGASEDDPGPGQLDRIRSQSSYMQIPVSEAFDGVIVVPTATIQEGIKLQAQA